MRSGSSNKALHRRRGFLAGCLVMLAWLCGLGDVRVQAQPAPPSEYELKAAFLYNFLHFVEWPADAFPNADSPIKIAILGDDPFGPALDRAMQDKTVNGRPVAVVRLKGARDQTNCHLLFISRSEGKRVPNILNTVNRNSILTVSEQEHFPDMGGIINFTMEGKKVRFEINLDAADQARLKVDPKLLKLAKVFRNPDSNKN